MLRNNIQKNTVYSESLGAYSSSFCVFVNFFIFDVKCSQSISFPSFKNSYLKFLRSKVLCFLFVFLTSFSVCSETIFLTGDAVVSGQVLSLNDDVVMVYVDKPFAYSLDKVKDIKVDEGVSGEERRRQEESVSRISKVIDKEWFLINDFKKYINKLLKAREFESLDTIVSDLMLSRERFPSGRLKEAEFYHGLDMDIGKRDVQAFEDRMSLIREWIAATETEASKVAFVSASIGYSWSYRGSGYSSTINKKAKDKYVNILEEAYVLGKQLLDSGSENLSLFAKLIAIEKVIGSSADDITRLANQAARVEPTYYGMHFAALEGLFPKWKGSYDEVETYIRRMSEKYGKNENKDLYFRLVSYVFERVSDRKFSYYQFNWDRLKSSFDYFESQYPVTEKHYHLMSRMAGVFGDKDSTVSYLDKTSKQWNFMAKDVWGKKAIKDNFIAWAAKEEKFNFSSLLTSFLSRKVPAEYLDYLELFVEYGGDINQTDAYGNSILFYLVDDGDIEMVNFALSLGADINQKNVYGRTPLYRAAYEGRVMLLNIFLASESIDRQNLIDSFLRAASNGYEMSVKLFLDYDLTLLNTKNSRGTTALGLAASYGRISVVEQLLDYDEIEINNRNDYGHTALHLSARKYHLDVVKALIERGADLTVKDHDNRSAIDIAAEKNHSEIVEYLKSEGASLSLNIVSIEDRRLARKIYDQSIPFFTKEGHQKGIELALQSLDINPNYALAHHGLAVLYLYHAHKYEKAVEHILVSLELDPHDSEAYYTAGRALHAAGKVEESRVYFKKYVELEPDTYNTQNLKSSFAHLIYDNVNPDGSKKTMFDGAFISIYNITLITILLILLGFLIKIRMTDNKKISKE